MRQSGGMVVVWLALVSVGWGRLYEIRRDCDARYNRHGKPAANAYKDEHYPLDLGGELETVTYDYQGWEVRAGFTNGYSVCLEYAKLPVSGLRKKLSDGAIQKILAANRGRKQLVWKHVPYDMHAAKGSYLELLYRHMGRVTLKSPVGTHFAERIFPVPEAIKC